MKAEWEGNPVIIGLGTDIIEISRIQAAVQQYGDRFLNRIYTSKELAYCHGFKNPYARLAVRFAAKEAVMKAMGSGLRDMQWREVEICRDPRGKPYVILHGGAQSKASSKLVQTFQLSMSHCHDFAMACCIAIGDGDR
jgi:holo-[acyl-carrier protein] synthase